MTSIKNIIYRSLDVVTLSKGFACYVNGFKIYFPAKWFRYFEKDYEKENISFLQANCKLGMTVIDVGAHLGLMSVISSKLVGPSGKVYSFEPTPNTFKVLQKVIALNKAEKIIQPVNKAIAKENGTIDFFLSSHEGSNSNSLVQKNHRERTAVKINVTSLDAFVAEQKIKQVDVIKIDAEGSEYDVLLGAVKTLSDLRPKMILALHPPLIKNNAHEISDIYDLLIKHNYSIHFENKVMTRIDFCSKTDFFDVHLIAS